MTVPYKAVIAVDFDGVIASVHGDEPALEPHATALLAGLAARNCRVVVYTARPDLLAVWDWLAAWDLAGFVDAVTHTKPTAHLYIDDRAITYNGDADDALAQVDSYSPWWSLRGPGRWGRIAWDAVATPGVQRAIYATIVAERARVLSELSETP
ncbi:MAG: hypothetical protein IT340_20155 [Chloroflexi bacterium]|nr:hypothetical protein [Chloroflexota bacterium]